MVAASPLAAEIKAERSDVKTLREHELISGCNFCMLFDGRALGARDITGMARVPGLGNGLRESV